MGRRCSATCATGPEAGQGYGHTTPGWLPSPSHYTGPLATHNNPPASGDNRPKRDEETFQQQLSLQYHYTIHKHCTHCTITCTKTATAAQQHSSERRRNMNMTHTMYRYYMAHWPEAAHPRRPL